ncbi:MAG: hypothetical protein AB4206_17840 [Xenococcaceae cyanobacterium]
MSFDIISAAYPPTNDIQAVRPRYSAQDLGTTIAIREPQNLSINPTQSLINPVYQLQLNSVTLSEENSFNSGMGVELKEIEQQFGQIDSVSTDITIGSVESELEIDSEDIKTEVTLLSESGFSFKIKKELQMSNIKPKIEPVIGFRKSLDWFKDTSKRESKDEKDSLQQAMRLGVPNSLTLNSANLNFSRSDQNNEIYDSLKDAQNLTKSLNSLITSRFATNTTFSIEGDLDNISAKLKFPVPGIFGDELELKIQTNIPEVLVDDEYLQDSMKSTLSLRYRIAIDEATKLEVQSSYDLQTKNHRLLLMAILE